MPAPRKIDFSIFAYIASPMSDRWRSKVWGAYDPRKGVVLLTHAWCPYICGYIWSGYAGTTINRLFDFCIYSVPNVGSMEIQSLGGIQPPEGGGLAYPWRVPVYMSLWSGYAGTTINRLFDFCIYSVPEVGSMNIQSLGGIRPRVPVYMPFIRSGYPGPTTRSQH